MRRPPRARTAAGKPAGPVAGGERTAVVVSSNLGNVATVCEIAAAVHFRDFREVSPLQTPNASSNVIASTIALRFGFTGRTSCCATARPPDPTPSARRPVAGRPPGRSRAVVGVEPDDKVAQLLAARRSADAGRTQPLVRAAAALILERADEPVPGAVVLGHGASLPPGAQIRPLLQARRDQLLLVPHEQGPREAGGPAHVVDLTARIGETYGAHGVLQVALAALWLDRQDLRARPAAAARTACGDPSEGFAWLDLVRVPLPGKGRRPQAQVPAPLAARAAARAHAPVTAGVG